MRGTVIKVMAAKKFGFIKGIDGKEYFFHQQDFFGFFDDLAMDFEAGRALEVEFNAVESQKGPRAGEVKRVDSGV